MSSKTKRRMANRMLSQTKSPVIWAEGRGFMFRLTSRYMIGGPPWRFTDEYRLSRTQLRRVLSALAGGAGVVHAHGQQWIDWGRVPKWLNQMWEVQQRTRSIGCIRFTPYAWVQINRWARRKP